MLKTSILLQYEPSSDLIPHGKVLKWQKLSPLYYKIVLAAYEDTLHHPDISVEMAIATIKLASQHERYVMWL